MTRSKLSLKWCLALAFFAVATVALVGIIAVNRYSQQATSMIVKELTSVAIAQMEEDSILALDGLGVATLKEKLERAANTQVVRYIELYDYKGELVALAGSHPSIEDEVAIVSHLVKSNDSLIPVTSEEKVVGKLVIGLDQSVLFESYNLSRWFYIALIVAMCIMGVVSINIIFSFRVLSPIRKIDQHLDLLSRTSWDEPKLRDLYGDEIGQVASKVDETSRTLNEISTRTKQIETQMVKSEERADAVLISSLTSIADTAGALDKEISDIDINLVRFLSAADKNDELSLCARDIFNAMRKVRSHVSILQASGEINRHIMQLLPRNISLADLIAMLSNVLGSDDVVDNVTSSDNRYCYIDYLRLSALLQKIAEMFGDFSLEFNTVIYDENKVLLNIEITAISSENFCLNEMKVKSLARVLLEGQATGDIGEILENNIIYLIVVSELLGADLNFSWSRVHDCARAILSIPVSLVQSGSSNVNVPRQTRVLTLVTDEEPVMPSRILVERYGVSVELVSFDSVDASELVNKDCVMLDCSENSVEQSVHLAKAIKDACELQNFGKPKVAALFYKAELTHVLLDNLERGGFDFPYHKPYKIDKILADFDRLVSMGDLPTFVGK